MSAAVLMIAAGAPSMAKDNPTQGPIGGPGTQGHKDNPTQIHGGS